MLPTTAVPRRDQVRSRVDRLILAGTNPVGSGFSLCWSATATDMSAGRCESRSGRVWTGILLGTPVAGSRAAHWSMPG